MNTALLPAMSDRFCFSLLATGTSEESAAARAQLERRALVCTAEQMRANRQPRPVREATSGPEYR